MGTPLIAGRDFTWSAIYQKVPEVIISENLARELWGNARAALGKHVREGAFRSTVATSASVSKDSHLSAYTGHERPLLWSDRQKPARGFRASLAI